MKTQEQIQQQIDLLWKKVEQIEMAIDEESGRWFPNKRAIAYLRKISDEYKAEVVHLSWVLI